MNKKRERQKQRQRQIDERETDTQKWRVTERGTDNSIEGALIFNIF